MRRSGHADVALAALATAWLGFAIARTPAWTVDDAFIVARYADNLVAHGALAFNPQPGEDRVEGFTSPLAMLLAIVARALGADPIAATKVVTVLAALACPALVVLLARRMRLRSPAGGVAAVLFALLPEHAVHARSGLETELFVASTLALLAAFARVATGRTPRARAFAAAALVIALVRPEGIAVAIVLSAVAVASRTRDRDTLVRELALVLLLPLAALTALRLAYFHALLPNTFYAKSAGWNGAHVRDLLGLADRLLSDVAIAAAALLVLSRLARVRVRLLPPRARLVLFASGAALAVEALGYARAEPIMDYGRRFAWHGAALLVPFALVAIDIVTRALRRMSATARPALAALPLLLGVVACDSALRSGAISEEDRRHIERERVSARTLLPMTAAWIDENTAPGALVAFYPDAGFVPYVTHRRAIDFGKLNDRELARARSDRDIVDYFFSRMPDAIVIGRFATGRLYDSGAEALVHDDRFRVAYELARTLPGDDATGDVYDVYRRRR